MMIKKRIAIIFGGNSTEYEVSLQSASAVFENINTKKFDIVPIGISRNGEWYHYTGEIKRIADNTWIEDIDKLRPVVVSQSPATKGMLELVGTNYRVIEIDLAFPVLHGKNGEDGTLQGLFEYLLSVAIHYLPLYAWTRTGHTNLSISQAFPCQSQ